MRIVFPVLTLCRGGAQRMLAELTNRLSYRGHEVILLMPPQGVVEYPVSSPIRVTDGALKAEDFPKADLIVSNFYTTVPLAESAAAAGKGVHARLALCYEPVFLPDNTRSFASYHATPHLFVLSRWQQEIVRLHHGIKGRIVPIGVDGLFTNLGLRTQPGRRLTVSAIVRRPEGGFSGHREQEYLLRELRRIKHTRPDTEVMLMMPPGELAESPELQALSREESFTVRTPADDRELCYHYNESHIFVSASTYDSGSLPGLEAMRCGAALVCVYSGGNLEYSHTRRNCLMSYRYEERLGADVLRLLEQPGLRSELAARGERDSRRFTWERSADLFERGLLQVLEEESGG
ncbi:glycosyltransferase family 4 protein [Paenibacillus glufosinatiresistens]|uniref:glycosyltransferase family 4 protein n=1 Tax=Paenibacillus glufosinatiresistens TaxID=3070657 RepID=UPI00286E361C|nr:glycosyltransferase family 4 protein [Paenibacillus sp. YX.27]